ncbi:MAG: translation initiation factor IF-1 [Candidatus Colwellbacteria bacterium RIFCSPHIGHO2_12_FULL_43_12]|uniref:Translation initiation factor IF-1 n=2 Tax=Candidatus Colwelliibacteriota TaxID=1817904 RepID=A0A1G1Z3A3_9BACT|nr:MAG: translation initiation factor IF-1 [Candidatus Colwellbacteria bacterium RIFCSPHIGHO2_12_FULL_43_12]OGY60750.1 MAG: translation initiation factor IF-1 [Candidatus Colwellbacteria bacterium RIFCSPLOWO2_12_FULL_43_11]
MTHCDNIAPLEKVNGTVLETLPGATFKVKLDDGRELLAYASGKIRMYRIKILLGDKVTVELTEYDDKRGRITRRL